MPVTLKKLMSLTEMAEKLKIEPVRVVTKEQADQLNREERRLSKMGLILKPKHPKWKVGDSYYTCHIPMFAHLMNPVSFKAVKKGEA